MSIFNILFFSLKLIADVIKLFMDITRWHMFKKIFSLVLVGCFPWIVGMAEGASIPNVQITEVKPGLERWALSNKEIMSAFERLQAAMEVGVKEKQLTKADMQQIEKALAFAADKHAKQFRNNERKTPYIVHPMGVAEYVMRVGHVYDVDIVVGALLHDVMDGTGATYEEIASHFGMTVVSYVQEMTPDFSLSDKEQQKRQIIEASKQSKGATVIKLADKLHNMHTLMKDPSKGWTQDRMDRHFQWVQAVVNHLPKVCDPLHKEVQNTITQYWQEQAE
jgi:guanosine-3',5'-bis(diphosphate) 3'-pyrophosphohydrolase